MKDGCSGNGGDFWAPLGETGIEWGGITEEGLGAIELLPLVFYCGVTLFW
jgi:hypothetical protein